VLLIAGIGNVSVAGFQGLAEANNNQNVEGLAALIFTRYLWAFELTGALLITAALGAMVLAHKEKGPEAMNQRQRSRARFASGHPHPLPGPGVFAENDSTATAALLPDGSEAPGSVDPALLDQHIGDVGGSVHHR